MPRSAIRNGRSRSPSARNISSASSTTVSVSGRGTSVARQELQRQAPEFLLAEDARDRFSREAPAGEFLDAFVRGGLALRCCDQAGQVEAEHMTDQKPRVEIAGSMVAVLNLRCERASRASMVWPAPPPLDNPTVMGPCSRRQ